MAGSALLDAERGGLGEIQALGDDEPVIHDGAVRGARAGLVGEVGCAEHEVAGFGVSDALADGLDGARDVAPDASG